MSEAEAKALDAAYRPFVRSDGWGRMGQQAGAAQWLSVAIVWATGLPLLRIVVCVATLLSLWLLTALSRFSPRLARALPALSKLHAALVLRLGLGFRVRVHGRPEQPATRVLVSNHVSWVDILVACSLEAPSFIAKEGVRAVPVVGLLASSLFRCVFVSRGENGEASAAASGSAAAAASGSATAAVRARLEELRDGGGSAPPLWVFPEGTTSNGAFLLPFKSGAFLASSEVQPVLLHYAVQDGGFSPAYESVETARSIFLVLSQLFNSVEVTYLPVCSPSKGEQPAAYAERVRGEMLQASNGRLTPSPLALKEKRAYHAALRANAAAAAAKPKST